MALKAPSSYNLVGLPPSVFGETYIFVSVWKSVPNLWEAEYSILVSRPDELLAQSACSVDLFGDSPELPAFEEGEMEAKALHHAEIFLEQELGRWAIARGREEWADLPLRLAARLP